MLGVDRAGFRVQTYSNCVEICSFAYGEDGLVRSLGDVTEFKKNEGAERDLIGNPFCIVLPGIISLVFLRQVEISEKRQQA